MRFTVCEQLLQVSANVFNATTVLESRNTKMYCCIKSMDDDEEEVTQVGCLCK